MKQRAVQVGPRAGADIRRIGRYIANFAGRKTADGYVERLANFVYRLDLASERGQLRDDIRTGLRVVPFEKSVILAVVVTNGEARVMRVFYRGQNWERILRKQFAKPD